MFSASSRNALGLAVIVALIAWVAERIGPGSDDYAAAMVGLATYLFASIWLRKTVRHIEQSQREARTHAADRNLSVAAPAGTPLSDADPGQAEVESAHRVRSDVLASVSHDIRTPMTAILGFTEALRRGFDNNEIERQECLEAIHTSGQQLLNLVDDILDPSQIDAGRPQAETMHATPSQTTAEAGTSSRGETATKDRPPASLKGVAGRQLSGHRYQPTGGSSIQGLLPGVRILVVDDGDTNRRLISLVLSRAGAVVECAQNGQEAVATVGSAAFDLVLMDMRMPVMDGYTATRLLRDGGFTMPIIALTADATRGTQEKCHTAGCTTFLAKPVDMDKLVQSLVETLRRQGSPCTTVASVSPQAPFVSAPSQQPIHSTLPTDDSDFCEIIAHFAVRLRQQRAAMSEAFAAGNRAELARLAHWLKGSGGMAGFHEFTEPARKLEQWAKEDGSDACIAGALADIALVSERIVIPALPVVTAS